MMINYVVFDEIGKLVGGFLQELQPEHAHCFIEVTEEQRLDWVRFEANADRASVVLLPPAPAPVIVPEEVTRRQGLQALYLNGVSRADVLNFINSMEDETARGLALIEYEEATTFRIDNQLVMAAAAHFNLDLPALFIQANSL